MKSLKLCSPAKINLFLKVTGRRPNGYHDLVTVFHRISLTDQITLRKRVSGFSLRSNIASLSCGEDNLIARAYRLLQRECKGLPGVAVILRKNIPIGGGLGGGSSNAAAFLMGMKKLFKLKISPKKMMDLGLELGADVPFFISGWKQALGQGVGEELQKVVSKKVHFFVLGTSGIPLSTKQVYQSLPKKLPYVKLTSVRGVVKLLLSSLEKRDYKKIQGCLENDLAQPAFELRPDIAHAMDCFKKAGLEAVQMSGSGPTVFGIARSQSDAMKAVKSLRKLDTSRSYLVCRSF